MFRELVTMAETARTERGVVRHSVKGRYWTGNFVAEPWYQFDWYNFGGKHKTTTYCR